MSDENINPLFLPKTFSCFSFPQGLELTSLAILSNFISHSTSHFYNFGKECDESIFQLKEKSFIHSFWEEQSEKIDFYDDFCLIMRRFICYQKEDLMDKILYSFSDIHGPQAFYNFLHFNTSYGKTLKEIGQSFHFFDIAQGYDPSKPIESQNLVFENNNKILLYSNHKFSYNKLEKEEELPKVFKVSHQRYHLVWKIVGVTENGFNHYFLCIPFDSKFIYIGNKKVKSEQLFDNEKAFNVCSLYINKFTKPKKFPSGIQTTNSLTEMTFSGVPTGLPGHHEFGIHLIIQMHLYNINLLRPSLNQLQLNQSNDQESDDRSNDEPNWWKALKYGFNDYTFPSIYKGFSIFNEELNKEHKTQIEDCFKETESIYNNDSHNLFCYFCKSIAIPFMNKENQEENGLALLLK